MVKSSRHHIARSAVDWRSRSRRGRRQPRTCDHAVHPTCEEFPPVADIPALALLRRWPPRCATTYVVPASEKPAQTQTFEHSTDAWILSHSYAKLPHMGGQKWNGVSLLYLRLTWWVIPAMGRSDTHRGDCARHSVRLARWRGATRTVRNNIQVCGRLRPL